MKFNIEVDCTPDEARRFLGFPDVVPMQERLLEKMEKRLAEAITSGDTSALMEQFLPFGAKGIEQWQSMWTQLATAASGFQKPARESKKD